MGFNKGEGSERTGRNQVGNNLRWTKTGDRGTVGGAAVDTQVMRKGYMI